MKQTYPKTFSGFKSDIPQLMKNWEAYLAFLWGNIPFHSSSLFKKKKLGKSNLSLLMIQSICIHSKNFYSEKYPSFFGFCCCSVSQSCLTLCNPMDCSTPGLPVLHYLLEFGQTHVHWAGDAIQPSHPLLSPSPPAFSLSQQQGLFQCVSSFHQVAKVLEL